MASEETALWQNADLQKLQHAMPAHTYERGEVLIHEGDEIDQCFYIDSGYVKLSTLTKGGDERIVLILRKGDIFPLLRNPDEHQVTSLYFYEAMTPVDIGNIPQAKLIETIKSDHRASWTMLRYISEFSSLLTDRLALLEGKNAEDKIEQLLRYLITVCGEDAGNGSCRLDLKLTHQEIANLIGLARETVSLRLKNLESQDILTQKDGYLYVNADELAAQ